MTRSMVCAALKSISTQSGQTESVASFHTPPAPKLSPARSPLLMADTGKEPLKVLDANATAPAEASATLTLVPPLPLTTCDSVELFEAALLGSPPYFATMLCVLAARLAVLQLAVFELAVPLGSATAAQPLRVVLSAVKATLPVGALPVTVAV